MNTLTFARTQLNDVDELAMIGRRIKLGPHNGIALAFVEAVGRALCKRPSGGGVATMNFGSKLGPTAK